MTTEQHPITPPPELLQQWSNDWHRAKVKHVGCAEYVTTQAARWGADQELEVCIEWLWKHQYDIASVRIRAARRPKPPSLAEAALEVVTSLRAGKCVHRNGDRMNVLTAALERLQELENNG